MGVPSDAFAGAANEIGCGNDLRLDARRSRADSRAERIDEFGEWAIVIAKGTPHRECGAGWDMGVWRRERHLLLLVVEAISTYEMPLVQSGSHEKGPARKTIRNLE